MNSGSIWTYSSYLFVPPAGYQSSCDRVSSKKIYEPATRGMSATTCADSRTAARVFGQSAGRGL
eukprot:5507490-Lingulodinium_polyedra.AAC.1